MNIPLISPSSIHDLSPIDYREYIKQLKIDYQTRMSKRVEDKRDPNASPIPCISFRTNDKGTQILTIRGRKPRYITKHEVQVLSKHYKITERELWNLCLKKNIEIRDADVHIY